MKLLVTGGFGYIGSNIVKRLIKEGHSVTILDNLSTSIINGMDNCALVRGDITQYDELVQNINSDSFDALLHLAAQSSGAASFKNPELDLKINILGTMNMIRLCDNLKIPRILFASSFTVYGDIPDREMLSEDLACQPKSLYSIGKQAGENYLRVYAESLGIKWNALRMFNVYGPGQDLSRKDQGIVSIFLSYVKDGDYVPVLGRLDRFRDLVYIDDVVNGWILALNKNIPNQVFNIGSGVKTTIADLIERIATIYEKNVQVEVVGHTPGDLLGCYADISKASSLLGYTPSVDLMAGLRKFKSWADNIDSEVAI